MLFSMREHNLNSTAAKPVGLGFGASETRGFSLEATPNSYNPQNNIQTATTFTKANEVLPGAQLQ